MRAVLFALFLVCPFVFGGAAEARFKDSGSWVFSKWDGAPLRIFYNIPPEADENTPILFIIAGARRNADVYCKNWKRLAEDNGFITLCPEGKLKDFPTEYDYNAGGVMSASGKVQAERKWLFSAIEPIFDDFVSRFSSKRKKYSIYGHSAGGGFVHLYMLMKPKARVHKAVSANAAFFALPTSRIPYPFGLGGLSISKKDLQAWLAKDLTIMLGELDIGPRTKPLSNGPIARQQGPSVYARGLKFFATALEAANLLDMKLNWHLEVVPSVGHQSTFLSPFAIKHLF